VTITQQQRSEIFRSLAGTVGEKEAEFIMSSAPPGGWEQFATKSDLAELQAETQAGFVGLNAKIDIQFAQLREQLAEQFAAIQNQFAAIQIQFAEVATRFAEVESRSAERFAEIETRFAEVESRSAERFAQIETRFAQVDTRFAEMSERRSKEVWAFAAAIAVMTISICGSIFLAI